ncbi:hypothetical protein CU052_13530 [Vibrio harveyi]|uniref:baseplate hub protein n=1 Tax=Vibrio harveyi TaxID=669 RepID=UPI000C799AA5|nr:hypothetical protein [Vibrio harveyi]AWB00254.1 hypothetical protein CU052_13530 [Vibrio harveyi]
MAAIDNRIMRVTIIIGDESRSYEKLAITAKGQKFTNANQGKCTITIANLAKEVRDDILTNTSPFTNSKVRSSIILEAGRESYGSTVVYEGDIYRSRPSQGPDNVLTLECLTGQFNKGVMVNRRGQPMDSLKNIAQGVADDNGLTLQFTADDRNISNYSYSGAAAKQVEALQDIAAADVYVDGKVLVVKPINVPASQSVRVLSPDSGMVGVPEFTEQGIKVTFLYDPQTTIGGMLEIRSKQNPATSGNYVIYKLSFNLTNREVPFYYTAEARRA